MTTVRIAPSVAVATCGVHCGRCGKCFYDQPAYDAHVVRERPYLTGCESPHGIDRLVGVQAGACQQVPDWRRPIIWMLNPLTPESVVVPGPNGFPVGRRVRRAAA